MAFLQTVKDKTIRTYINDVDKTHVCTTSILQFPSTVKKQVFHSLQEKKHYTAQT